MYPQRIGVGNTGYGKALSQKDRGPAAHGSLRTRRTVVVERTAYATAITASVEMDISVLALFVILMLTPASANQLCSSTSAREMSFQLRSRRNMSGHWNLQVEVMQGVDSRSEYRETNPVLVRVDQKSLSCDGKETFVTIATLSSSPPLAGPGYQLFPGMGYYKLHLSQKNWEEARVTCFQEGAHLAIINSQAEADVLGAIFKLYSSAATYVAFIGFHDHYFEGQFITVLGRSLESSGYLRWSSSEPSGSRLSNCGCVYPTGLLCDVGCEDKLSFFCEQELF
ncbi:hemolymph lipopolysaccharide-binding protein [Anabrus simplex]|uniref:hemolymph lipopolysaccharide-binding protein n=1 Tax=Anabrus simplex TaxID=316456 RepID=UPI0035A3BCC8